MCDKEKPALLQHATWAITRSALLHAELRISFIRLTDDAFHEDAPVGTLAQVERLRKKMLGALAHLQESQAAGLEWCWCRFIAHYDDYIEAIRQAKCELAHAEYWTMLAMRVHDMDQKTPRKVAQARQDCWQPG